MHRSTALIARTMIIILGAAVGSFLLYEPWMEGRNVGASVFRVYFQDPFLIYAYASSLPFFIGLRQLWKIGAKRQTTHEHIECLAALQIIQRCASATAILAAGAIGYFVLMMSKSDDIAGGIAMGVGIIVLSLSVAVCAHSYREKYVDRNDEH